jgi:hypothetical protein
MSQGFGSRAGLFSWNKTTTTSGSIPSGFVKRLALRSLPEEGALNGGGFSKVIALQRNRLLGGYID